jgi:hypothetical protein
LFYVASDGKFMSVDISAKPVFAAGAPRPLFQLPPGFIGGEVTADGRRFLIGVPLAQSASVPFTVVLNWQTALKKWIPPSVGKDRCRQTVGIEKQTFLLEGLGSANHRVASICYHSGDWFCGTGRNTRGT